MSTHAHRRPVISLLRHAVSVSSRIAAAIMGLIASSASSAARASARATTSATLRKRSRACGFSFSTPIAGLAEAMPRLTANDSMIDRTAVACPATALPPFTIARPCFPVLMSAAVLPARYVGLHPRHIGRGQRVHGSLADERHDVTPQARGLETPARGLLLGPLGRSLGEVEIDEVRDRRGRPALGLRRERIEAGGQSPHHLLGLRAGLLAGPG